MAVVKITSQTADRSLQDSDNTNAKLVIPKINLELRQVKQLFSRDPREYPIPPSSCLPAKQ